MKQQAKELFETVKHYYKTQQYTHFFQLIDAALLLAEQHDDTETFIDFTLDKVAAYFQLGDYEIAIQALKKIEELIGDQPSEARIRYVNSTAAIHGALEDYEACYTYLLEAKKLAEHEQSLKGLMLIEGNMSNYFYETAQYEEALQSMEKALAYCIQIAHEQEQVYMAGRTRYIQIFIKLNRLDEAAAQIAYVKSFPNYKSSPHYKYFVTALADYECAREQYDNAYARLQQAMDAYSDNETAYNHFYEQFVQVAEHVEPVEQYVDTLKTYYEYLVEREQEQQMQRSKRIEMYFKMDHLEQLIWLDPLTEIKNRRYLEDYADKWLREHEGSVAAVLFDADHFKTINDTYGHAVGDDVICLMAKSAATFFEKQDALFVRYGGDEFLALCRVESEGMLMELLQTLQQMMHAQSYTAANMSHSLSISIGATLDHTGVMNVEQLIAEADMALYAVKNEGRRHFVLYERP